ncbi:Tn3 family transposase [Streptomyces sp. NPDC001822]|uniref:Tn3 family transposase n=1 Tax=Streptomyces sp. NPDC001822 TaxID=3364614 RepID=UPI0036C58450
MSAKQLNITEARHGLACRIFFGQRGEPRQNCREGMEDQLGALGLALNAVVLWDSLYLERAAQQLAADGFPVTDDLPARLSPLRFDHINFLGRNAFLRPHGFVHEHGLWHTFRGGQPSITASARQAQETSRPEGRPYVGTSGDGAPSQKLRQSPSFNSTEQSGIFERRWPDDTCQTSGLRCAGDLQKEAEGRGPGRRHVRTGAGSGRLRR